MSEKPNAREELASALDMKKAYEELQAFPAWQILKAQLEKQVQIRTERVMLTPLKALDSAMEQEFEKGEVAGIRLVLALPQQMFDDLSFEVDKLLKEMEEENGREE